MRSDAQSGKLDDVERRNRAAAFATRFAEMMLSPDELESSDED